MKRVKRQNRLLSCGPCTACCIVYKSKVIPKEDWTPCPHLRAEEATIQGHHVRLFTGCGIYPKRPVECQKFQCDWKLGRLGSDEASRPLESGIVIATKPPRDGPTDGPYAGKAFVEIREVVPGGIERSHALIAHVAKTYNPELPIVLQWRDRYRILDRACTKACCAPLLT